MKLLCVCMLDPDKKAEGWFVPEDEYTNHTVRVNAQRRDGLHAA